VARRRPSLAQIALGVSLLLVPSLLTAQEARAVGTNIHITGTGTDGVNMRSGPGTGYGKVGWLPEGASPDYVCYSWGELVGPVPIWFNVSYGGATGFYASYYDDSSYSSDADLQNKYHVPLCGANTPTAPAPAPAPDTSAPATSTPATSTPTTAVDGYNRGNAVAWARAHAKDKPYDGSSCTWFVSQVLWQGGLAKTSTWTSDGTHGHIHREPGTSTAFYTPDFVKYILNTYPRSFYRQLSFSPSGNKIAGAEVGDVITYDWDGNTAGGNLGGLDHAAVITRIDNTGYPLVSEWSANGKKESPYVERGWTWSKLHDNWLAKLNPKIRAWVLHIDTRPI
jgi:uncharacterized protein YraI